MATRIPLQLATAELRLAKPVVDADGRILAGAGTRLVEGVVRLLRRQAILTVMVEGDGAVEGWEAIRPLPDELAALERRFDETARNAAMTELHDAVARHLARRAARYAVESGEDDG